MPRKNGLRFNHEPWQHPGEKQPMNSDYFTALKLDADTHPNEGPGEWWDDLPSIENCMLKIWDDPSMVIALPTIFGEN